MSGYTLPDLDLCGRACRGLNQRQPFLTSNTVITLLFGFFFQAEDGIRDDLVTGVQTCALPISSSPTATAARTPTRATGRAATTTRARSRRTTTRARTSGTTSRRCRRE